MTIYNDGMDQRMVAIILDDLGSLLEMKGENVFKVRAYHNAARVIATFDQDFEAVVREKRLTSIRGIGKALAAQIEELVTTGRLPMYEELRREFPLVFKDLLQIPGLGPRKTRAVITELGIASVDELEAAGRAGRIAALPGFGEKTQEKILAGIEQFRKYVSRRLLIAAEREAEPLVHIIAALPQVDRAEVAGSIRRRMEIVKDIDIVVSTRDPGPVMEMFTGLPAVAAVTARGDTKTSVRLLSGIAADLRCVTSGEYPAALLYFTGSKEHNVGLRARAIRQGRRLNEYGLFKDLDTGDPANLIPAADEAGIYRALGLAYIEPELREGRGEIEAAEAGPLPHLIETADIKGVIHVHTDWSDGRASLSEMVEGAIALGYQYIGITEHSQSAGYAGGLSVDRVRQQQAAIDRLNEELAGRFVILKGIESDIRQDGSLDYPDDVLATFDYVIGSLHTFFRLEEAEQTARLVKAVSHPLLRILGHPTGRQLLTREPAVFNLRAVLEAAAANQVAVEINASPRRLDLDWRDCRTARDLGCVFTINPDAHDPAEYRYTRYGIDTARKGWLTARDVINTLGVDELRKFLLRA